MQIYRKIAKENKLKGKVIDRLPEDLKKTYKFILDNARELRKNGKRI
ncbi:MAG: hypothetical protein V1824_04525 [archaeon]